MKDFDIKAFLASIIDYIVAIIKKVFAKEAGVDEEEL